ncbi:SdrD B-like domain-containing protein [Methanolapillus ohkumae]
MNYNKISTKIMKAGTSVFLIMMILLAGFVMPVAADPVDVLTSSWKSPTPSGDAQIIEANATGEIIFNINGAGLSAGTYYLKIHLKNNDSGDSTSGLQFSDATAKGSIPEGLGDQLNNTLPAFSTTDVNYTLKNPQQLSLSVFVLANSKVAYNNETAVITATLFKEGVDSNPDTEIKNISAKAVCQYPTLDSYSRYYLMNPALLPSGVNTTVNVSCRFFGGTAYYNLFRMTSMRIYNQGYVLDFSDVIITINGIPTKYSELPNPKPVTFLTEGGLPLEDGNKLSFSSTALSKLDHNATMKFQIQLTDEFKYVGSNAPSIDFTGLKETADVKINNRGPVEHLNTGASGELFPHTPPGVIAVAEEDQMTKPVFISAVSQTSSYIMANSLQYGGGVRDHFKYQELFRIGFRGAIRDGENVIVNVEIPNGVTVTHLRLPKEGDDTVFKNITLMDKDGNYKKYGNSSSHGINLSTEHPDNNLTGNFNFGPGDDITFEIEGLLKMTPNSMGGSSYSDSHLIHVVGTTNESVNTGSPTSKKLSFKGKVTGAEVRETFYNVSVIDEYKATTYVTSANYVNGSSVNQGETFPLLSQFNASTYPYWSAHRTNPLNPLETSLFPNPVVYFSIPPGMTVKDAHLQNKECATAPIKDIQGNEIIFEKNIFDNAGYWKDDGGKLVEVKLKKKVSDGENNFWLIYNNSLARYTVQLDVEVPVDYVGPEQILIPRQSVLLTTWDPKAIDASSGGSGGGLATLSNVHITNPPVNDLHVKTGTVTPYGSDKTALNIVRAKTVQAYVSTKTSGGYASYDPDNTASIPELKAGSSNEEFKMYVNNAGETDYTNAYVYFILPKGTGWKATINKPLTVEPSSGMETGSYKVYYTTNTTITTGQTLDSGNLAGYGWTEMNFDANNKSTTVSDELKNITAVRVEFTTLKKGTDLKLYLPFELPKVDEEVHYGDTAAGQTLYYFDNSFKSDKGFTGAIKLIQSDKPVIMGDNAGTPVAIGGSVDVTHETGTIPDWTTVYTYDDFTEDIHLAKVEVNFTPKVGSPTNTTIETGFTNASYVKMLGASSPDPNYVAGNKVIIPDASSLVNVTTPGTYTITYYTTDDFDNQIQTGSRQIVIKKDPSTIVLDPVPAKDIFWKSSVPTTPANNGTWEDYYRTFMTGNDTNVPISLDKFKYEGHGAGGAFNISEPGTYVLIYNYTDSGDNTVNKSITVHVKYNGTLSGNVTGNGQPVGSQSVSVDTGSVSSATTDSSGKYTYALSATTTDPKNVSYNASLSVVPAGLILPSPIPSKNGVAKASDNGAPKADFVLDPVTINVTFTDPSNWINSVSLYNSSGSKIQEINISDIGSDTYFLFEKEAGQGWFAADDYSITVNIKPGYKPAGGSEFTQKDSAMQWSITAFTMANENITIIGGDSADAPIIAGHVWDDENHDSIWDREIEIEPLISGVEVKLLNSDSAEVETTNTDEDGFYYFPNVEIGSSYFVQINLPSGFNHASDFQLDQMIDKDNDYKSELILISENMGEQIQYWGVNAGFYYAQDNPGSGGPVGNATIVPMSEPMKGTEEKPPEENKTPEVVVAPFDENPPVNPESFSMLGLIFVLLSVLLALPQLLRIYKIKSEKQEKSVTFHILAIVLAVIILILFFLFYSLSGEMNYYNTTDLVLAAAFIVEALLTAKAYGKI